MNAQILDRLKSQLLTSGLSQQNNPLFQIINSLIDAAKEGVQANNIISGGGGTPAIGGQTFLTWLPEQANGLPSSRQLIAGPGIQFNNDGVRLIISATEGTLNRLINEEMGPRGFIGPRGIQGNKGDLGPRGLSGDCCDDANNVGFPLGTAGDLSFGVGTLFALVAGDFTASGTMTWSVGTINDYTYIILGKLMFVFFNFAAITVGGVVSIDLKVTIPQGKISKKVQQTTFIYNDNGVFGIGQMFTLAGGTTISFRKGPGTVWTLSAGASSIQGTHIFEIQ